MLKQSFRKRHYIFFLVLILSVAFLVSGCASNTNTGQTAASTGQSGTSQQGGSTSGIQSSTPKVGLDIGDIAPDFTVTMNDGKSIKLSALRGKPVFLNFWATWCPPCRMEMPDIQKISTEDHNVQIVALNLKESPTTVRSFLTKNGYTYPVGFDTNGSIADLYGVSGIPTSYAIDAKGIIRFRQEGVLIYSQLNQWFSKIEQ